MSTAPTVIARLRTLLGTSRLKGPRLANWGMGTLVVFFFLVLTAGLAVIVAQQHRRDVLWVESGYWGAAQLEIETLRAIAALDAMSVGAGEPATASQRFDILWSRVAYFDGGEAARTVSSIDGAAAILEAFRNELAKLEPAVASLANRPEEAPQVALALRRQIAPLHEFGVLVRGYETRTLLMLLDDGGTTAAIMLSLAAVEYLVGSLIVALLLRSMTRTRSLLSEIETAQRAADRAHSRLMQAVEALPQAFVLFDEEDRLSICNLKYREIYANVADLIVPGVRFETLLRAGISRYRKGLNQADQIAHIRHRMRLHRCNPGPMEVQLDDGRWILVEDRLTSDGCVVGLRTDITNLRLREEELRRSRRSLADAQRLARIGSWEWSPTDERINCSDEADRLLDSPLSADVENGWINEAVRACRETGESYREERAIRDADAEDRLLVITAHTEYDPDGTTCRIIGTVQDITDQRAAEAALIDAKQTAERASLAKSDFLAMMSHEIRTPLNGVIGTLGLIMDHRMGSEPARLVTVARRSAENLLAILNDILDLSKMEAGRLEFEDSAVDLHDVMDGVVDLITPAAQEKKLAIHVSVDPDLPPFVRGDEGRIRQVLLNLAGNAVKFTEVGQIGIQLSAVDTEIGEVQVRVSVIDTGMGIPHDRQHEVFAEFNQLDRSYARRFGGTGLGLAICKRLVQLMGGQIGFSSEPAQGSTFWFSWPLTAAERQGDVELAQSGPEPNWEEELSRLGRRPRVLVAEDNATNQLIVRTVLERAGCRVDTVANGVEAVQAAALGFDIIFMDLQMPEMDGLEAAVRIRSSQSDRRCPIVALTANALGDERRRCEEAGMDGFLLKPVKPQALQQAIMAALRREATTIQSTAETPGPEEEQAIDADILDGLAGELDESSLDSILAFFIDDTRLRADRLIEAAKQRNMDMVKRESHSLAGSAQTFGAVRLATLCRRTEEACLLDETASAQALVESIGMILEHDLTALAEAARTRCFAASPAG
ncbi:response regulator (plasmid) [Azospirillum argentinense]|uniref:histidine kinase n=1 Tax=Azospirillum argentinense TaxID=2970906 RepID=A0A4D8PG46_9PROT|nr:ATP-binding protein [Azospirillum argentinense]QCN97396.1 response regulator [Azospirillum argentinense]